MAQGTDVQDALSVVWSAANGICAKRPVPFLPELVPTLERHGHLVVTDEVREQLLAISPATVDRLLRPLRQPHGLSTTKPGRLLKHQIPIRTFAEWTDVKPGFIEGDLVAHCGGSAEGAFLYTCWRRVYLHREWRNWVVTDWQRLARMRLKVGGDQAG